MRMWMVNTSILCRKHLLGEHVETHMFLGTLKRNKSITGYLNNNLFEPKSLKIRHDDLAKEMKKRGMNHKSNFPNNFYINNLTLLEKEVKVNIESSLNDLINRCLDCYKNYNK